MDINNQYITSIKKGDSVTFWNGSYRVQEDKGWLHIVIKEKDIRKKYSVSDLLFEYGSESDYIFNKWWLVYPSYTLFKQYANAEIAWFKDK